MCSDANVSKRARSLTRQLSFLHLSDSNPPLIALCILAIVFLPPSFGLAWLSPSS